MAYLIAEKGPLKGLILELEEKNRYTIGRDPDLVDYVLEDSNVSRKHVSFFKKNDALYVEDLSHTNPIFVNDKNITKPHLLKDQDKIKIGQTIFTYKSGTPPEKPKKEISPPSEKFDYDTIFEEDSEEELPFSIISEYPFLLKVISGPNSGAEFGMEKDKNYIIGKDPNICDITFNDLSVSKEHAKIKIDPDGNIFIEDLKSKNGIFVNQEKIENKTKISSQDLLSLGTTSFLIIDQKATYETIYSEPPQPKREPTWKDEAIPSKYLLISGSILVAIFIMTLSFFSLFKSKPIETVKKEPTKQIEEILQKYENVKFSYNPANDKLFLTGHMLTASQEKELFYDIDSMEFIQDVENTIIIDEYVWQNTNKILSENPSWRGVSMRSKKPGIFLLDGYLKNLQDLESLQDYMNTNFPYVDKLVYEVVIENVLDTEIASILISCNLSNISYQITNGELVLAGRYSDGGDFKKAVKILKETKGIRNIKNVAIQTSEQKAMVDISSKYIITGSISQNDKDSNVIIHNIIYAIGDVLDGMKITDIKRNIIYLEKDGIKYKISYK